jgi:outer membrane lipoprotein-sorting protein
MRTLIVTTCLAATAFAQAFSGDAEGRALYDKMVGALAQAKTLRYVCEQRREYGTWKSDLARYRVWLEKPNQFRIESTRSNGQAVGTLIGDGENLWVHWAKDRPFFSTEERADWEATARNVYMRERAPVAMHSIAHKLSVLGGGLGMAIINPSLFHGAKSSLDPYLDGVKSLGKRKVDGETCDGFEISYMKHQRSKYVWISRRDHLPRELKEVVRVSKHLANYERWTKIAIDKELDESLFRWTPPPGWKKWRLPKQSDRLLETGATAPDFEARSMKGKKIGLADYRGKVLWLVFWRVG